jgi:hypothetical protein
MQATAYSAGSALMSLLPDKANIVGKDDSPAYTAVRWRHVGVAADSIACDWITYDGIKGSGRTPSKYQMAAITKFDRQEMDSLLASGGIPAMAYRLGTAAMSGSSKTHNILGLEHDDDEYYQNAMRVGGGQLIVLPGKHIIEKRRPLLMSFRAVKFIPLKKGVVKGPVMPISEVPLSVPIL